MLQNYLLLLILASASRASSHQEEMVAQPLNCGTSTYDRPGQQDWREVVGGHDVRPGELPWQVELVAAESGRHRCGASLIGERHIITAAHCLFKCREQEPVEVVAVVGAHKMGAGRRYELDRATWHESYCGDPEANHSGQWFDIGLLRTIEPVAIGLTEAGEGSVNVICLPRSNAARPEPDEQLLVSGWGRTEFGSSRSHPDTLQALPLKQLEDEQCTHLLQKHSNILQQGAEICAIGDEANQSHCKGDSGGPLTRTTADGTRELVGVVSRSAECGSTHLPAIFTRVAEYLDWIQANMED